MSLMATGKKKPKAVRRRGKALEDAVLDAAWCELLEGGYASFTMDAVATRAHTSRQVLYRRWPNRADLAMAAMQYVLNKHPVIVPNTGNVRDDLIALLRQVSEDRGLIAIAILSALQMSNYFSETNSSPVDLRASLLQGDHSQFDTVLARGVGRGEIDASKLTPRLVSLLADLMRHEAMMTLKPVPDAVIAEFVDDIFLPLVRTQPPR